jgi:hypothetical protein
MQAPGIQEMVYNLGHYCQLCAIQLTRHLEAQLNHDLDAYLSRVPRVTVNNKSYPIKGTKAIIAP